MQVPPQLIATSVAGGAGAAALAAHTVVRQLFEFWGLIFTAFNIATQSLVASALAKVSWIRFSHILHCSSTVQ